MHVPKAALLRKHMVRLRPISPPEVPPPQKSQRQNVQKFSLALPVVTYPLNCTRLSTLMQGLIVHRRVSSPPQPLSTEADRRIVPAPACYHIRGMRCKSDDNRRQYR